MHGRWTRGTTARGRLAVLDAVIVRLEGDRLARADGSAFVDVGFGAAPWTLCETASLLRERDPGVPVVGVELDSERVAAARDACDEPGVRFVHGGFEAVAAIPGGSRLVRAMNLLRSYPVDEAPAALRALGAGLVDQGLLVEGTCGRQGEVLTASWVRRRRDGLVREALLLHTDFSGGFAPKMFWPRLPRDLRRHPAVDALIERWDAAWRQSRSAHETDPARFAASVRALSDAGDALDTDPWLLGRGVLRWTAPPAML